MSTGVSEHQRSKGQGNSGKPFNKFPNGPKGAEHEDVESWRNQQQQQQQQHHQGYAGMAATSDPYMSSYYGASFQYPTPTFGVGDAGPWSNGGDMFLSGGYSAGMHDSAAASGHYNIDGMFGAGNGASFGNFSSGQPGFGYGFHGNGDYNTWGQPQPRKHYDDYYSRDNMYSDDRGIKMVEQSMGGLSLDKDHGGLKELKESMQQGGGGGGKKTTWASIASQPAKPQSLMKKKGQAGMPPPPIIPGTWENKNGTVPIAKAPIAAPVQAPRPAAWERPKIPPSGPPQQGPPPPPPVLQGMQGAQNRGYQNHHGQPHMNYMPSQPHPPPPTMMQQQQHSQLSSHPPPLPPPQNNIAPVPSSQPPQPQYPDELKMKNEYNPPHFDLTAEGTRFFVIKSYSEDDIHRSIKYEIWCSTEHGNNRLDQAFREREGKGPVYLFFSVNGSGHFCGMAQMVSAVDYEASSSVWCQDKWKGQFKVKWIYVKDVTNAALRHIKLENNENKPVTNSRDTQEVPFEKGKQVLQILHSYVHTTSIFDDFIHYEKRQEEEDQRRTSHQPPSAHSTRNHDNANHGGRGGMRGGGGGGGPPNHHHPRDRDSYNNHRDNPRGGDREMNHRGGDKSDAGGYHGGGRMQDRNDHMRSDRPDHYQMGGGGGRSYDNRDRDFHPRDRDHRGGRGGGSGGSRPRN